MEFLKSILGDDLYNQFAAKINEYNGNEANKDKLIKLANLTDGGYVSKDKFTALETDKAGVDTELLKANGLIETLKKTAGKDAETQGKITAYETEIASLKKENETLKTENALKFALKDAGAVDVDYLVYKAKEKGDIKLDTDGKIKGIDDLITGLKTQIPAMFASGTSGSGTTGRKVLDPNTLPGGSSEKTVTAEQFHKMGYAERLQLKKDSPEQWKTLTNNN